MFSFVISQCFVSFPGYTDPASENNSPSVKENIPPSENNISQVSQEILLNSANSSGKTPLSNKRARTSLKPKKTITKEAKSKESTKFHAFNKEELTDFVKIMDRSIQELMLIFDKPYSTIITLRITCTEEKKELLDQGFTEEEAHEEIVLNAISYKKIPWAPEEIEVLNKAKEENPKLKRPEIARLVRKSLHPDRSLTSVISMLSKLFSSNTRAWSEKDKTIVFNHRKKNPTLDIDTFIKQVMPRLNTPRNKKSIWNLMQRSGLLIDQPSATPWSPTALEIIKSVIINNPKLPSVDLSPLVREQLDTKNIEKNRTEIGLRQKITKIKKEINNNEQ